MSKQTTSTPEYHFRQYKISVHMMTVIRRYIDDRVLPGSFLRGVITNNFQMAVGHADDFNITQLPAFLAYFYQEAPSECWGSPEAMSKWVNGPARK